MLPVILTATIYADLFEGRMQASGVPFHHAEMTVAHRTFPIGCEILVEHRGVRKWLKVTDRCPRRRVLDMSRASARALRIHGRGMVKVLQMRRKQ